MNIKLYTEEELKHNLNLLDKLMSKFSYGYKSYLKRDLGCFTFYKRSKNILGTNEINNFGRKWYDITDTKTGEMHDQHIFWQKNIYIL